MLAVSQFADPGAAVVVIVVVIVMMAVIVLACIGAATLFHRGRSTRATGRASPEVAKPGIASQLSQRRLMYEPPIEIPWFRLAEKVELRQSPVAFSLAFSWPGSWKVLP